MELVKCTNPYITARLSGVELPEVMPGDQQCIFSKYIDFEDQCIFKIRIPVIMIHSHIWKALWDSQRYLFVIEAERKWLNRILIQMLLITEFVTLGQAFKITLTSRSPLYVF